VRNEITRKGSRARSVSTRKDVRQAKSASPNDPLKTVRNTAMPSKNVTNQKEAKIQIRGL